VAAGVVAPQPLRVVRGGGRRPDTYESSNPRETAVRRLVRREHAAVRGTGAVTAGQAAPYRCNRGAMIRYAFSPSPSRSRSSESSGSSPVSSFTRSSRYATVCRCA
jgi:hypothetical protein